MNIHDATEIAYKNGYEAGYKDALKAILTTYKRCDICIPRIVEQIAEEKNIVIEM